MTKPIVIRKAVLYDCDDNIVDIFYMEPRELMPGDSMQFTYKYPEEDLGGGSNEESSL